VSGSAGRVSPPGRLHFSSSSLPHRTPAGARTRLAACQEHDHCSRRRWPVSAPAGAATVNLVVRHRCRVCVRVGRAS
jgi:hypothetical protein